MSVLCNCRFKCSRLFSNLESFSQLLLTFKPTDVAFKIDFSKLWYSKKILVPLKSYFLWQYKSQLVSSYRQVLVVPFPPLYCRKLFSQNWSWKVQKRPKRPQREENKFCPSHSNTHAWARRKIILALTHLMWIPPHKLPISITLSLSHTNFLILLPFNRGYSSLWLYLLHPLSFEQTHLNQLPKEGSKEQGSLCTKCCLSSIYFGICTWPLKSLFLLIFSLVYFNSLYLWVFLSVFGINAARLFALTDVLEN